MQPVLRAAEELPLTPIHDLKKLRVQQADKGTLVRVRGVVSPKIDTAADFFLLDQTNGIYVNAEDCKTPIKAGQEIEIEGITNSGTFMPMIDAKTIRVLGEGKFPPPLDLSGDMVLSRELDARLVKVKAIVVAANKTPVNPETGRFSGMLYTVIPGGNCLIFLNNLPESMKFTNLVGARIRAIGMNAPTHDTQRRATGGRVFVFDSKDLEVLIPGVGDPASITITPINQLGPAEMDYSNTVIKRIRGTVTAAVSPTSYFLQDETSGVMVRSYLPEMNLPGKTLELLGIMQKIGNTEVFTPGFQVNQGESPLPAPVAITQANLSDLTNKHVRGRLEATVLHTRVHIKQGVSRVRAVKKGSKFEAVVDPVVENGPRFNEKTFEMALKFGSSVIYAHVPESIMDERAFEVGSNVRVTGTLDSFMIPESGYQGTTLYPVQAKDLEYLTGPPTSPTEFLLMGLGLACGLAAAVIAWNLSLRNRVRSRTAELAKEKERLLDSEARYRRLADNSFDVIWTMDLDGNFTYLSPSVEKTRGYTPEEFVQLPKDKIYSPESLKVFVEAMAEGRQKIEAGIPVFFHREMSGPRKDGSMVWMDVKATSVRDADGKFLEILGVTREITQRKLAEEERERSENRYRSLTEASAQAVWRANNDGTPIKDMPSWLAYTGLTWDQVKTGGWFQAIHPDDREKARLSWEKSVREDRNLETEYRLRRHDGEYRVMEVRGVPIKDPMGKTTEWVGTCTDITERKQADELIQTALREKEILLKEIHHRVKNNLQTITALLDLQAEKVQNREVWELLRESRGRVRSMSLIHERLYRTQDQGRVNFKEYLESLITYLNQSYRKEGVRVHIHLNIHVPLLSLDQAIPCGLLVNELLMNAFKHAFPDRTEGKIEVDMRPGEPTLVCLKVRDDGIGLPADLNLDTISSFGLTMVQNLAQQLQGRLEFKNDSGSVFNVCFPLMDPFASSKRKPS